MGLTVATATPVLSGIMLDNNQKPLRYKRVSVYVDGRLVALITTNGDGVWSYRLTHQQALHDGVHIVQASVRTSATTEFWGRCSFFIVYAYCNAYRSGNVDASDSFINFPSNGCYVNTRTPVITGSLLNSSFHPVSGETVTITIDGTTIGSPTSDSNGIFSYTITTSLTEASHVVAAHCVQSNVDLTSNTFTVDVTPPVAPTVTSPTQNSIILSLTGAVTVSGTTEPNATVTVFMDGNVDGDISYADGSGNWSIDYTLTLGAHSLTAQATDLANNNGPLCATRNFTLVAL